MLRYSISYRLGLTPWERYVAEAADGIAAILDREQADRDRPPGRALDLGCGRGLYAEQLVGRGWQVTGVDVVPQAVAAADRRGLSGATFVTGDVTDLANAVSGTFDLFLDVGCFQGLDADQRLAEGRGVTGLAAPGATLLLLAFQPTSLRSVIGGVSQHDVETAFPAWELMSVDAADTHGLGWPMSRTMPQWYRLRTTRG